MMNCKKSLSMSSPKKIHIVFPGRERLLELVEKENRAINIVGRLEATSIGHYNLTLESQEDSPSCSIETVPIHPVKNGKRARHVETASSKRRNLKSFVDFKDSDDFKRFVTNVHQYLITRCENEDEDDEECLVKLSEVKKHFYDMNPPYAPKDSTAAFMNLVNNGILEPVPDKRLYYRILV